jgi:predicted AAA+ superfamily ATPase
MELYATLGFTDNPFSTFSAEEEKPFLNEIYINPLFYETLKSDLIKGHSRFILGARGIGKTALLLQLRKALETENVFTIIIDEFDGVPVKNNEIELARLIIENLITNYCVQISKSPRALKKLNKHQKEKLSFIIRPAGK